MAQVRESRQELRRFMREARRGNPACVVSMQHDTLYCTVLYCTVLYYILYRWFNEGDQYPNNDNTAVYRWVLCRSPQF